MNYSRLSRPEKLRYQSPVSDETVLGMESMLCQSNWGGTTEEWEEIDLSMLGD